MVMMAVRLDLRSLKILGHSKISTTEKYAQVPPPDLHDAMQAKAEKSRGRNTVVAHTVTSLCQNIRSGR